MGKKFYIATASKGFSEERTFYSARDSLLGYLEENEEGTIDCFQFLEGEEGEYECLTHRGYKKVNNELKLIEEW